MGNLLYWTEKALYLLIGGIVVLFVLSFLKIWGMEQNNYFLFVGDFESVLVILIIVTVATFVLEKLWKWEVRQIFKPHPERRRPR